MSKVNNPGDLIFVRTELDNVLKEASKYAQQDNETKKQFVLRVKEKAIILFEQEKRPLSELASFIWNKLNAIEFSIAKAWFESCFTEEQKRNYLHKFSSEHFTPTDIGGVLRNPISGQIKIDEIVYSPDLPMERSQTLEKEAEPPKYNKDKYTDLINLIGETASKLETTCDAILERYGQGVWYMDKHTDEKVFILTPRQVQDIVQSSLQPIEDKQKEYAGYYAKIANSKDVLDDRNKWGWYEKGIAKYEMQGGETIAHMSKLMDYSSKFGSIGILNNPELETKIKQLGECVSCGCNIYFEMNERLKQIEIQAEFVL